MKFQPKFKFSGRIAEDNVHHSIAVHAEHGYTIAPTYVTVPDGSKVPQYSTTVYGRSTKYDPPNNCEGNFMSYKFQPNNNCYNYGTNVATNSFAQPGRMTGNPLPENWTGDDVVKGAESDGLVLIPNGADLKTWLIERLKAHPEEHGHLVALMISSPDTELGWPGDYHWARCDNTWSAVLNGNPMEWSQKDGTDQVTNFDFAGNPITDPQTADWVVNEGRIQPSSDNDVVISYPFFAYMFVPDNTKISII